MRAGRTTRKMRDSRSGPLCTSNRVPFTFWHSAQSELALGMLCGPKVRLASSIKQGIVTASLILRKLGRLFEGAHLRFVKISIIVPKVGESFVLGHNVESQEVAQARPSPELAGALETILELAAL